MLTFPAVPCIVAVACVFRIRGIAYEQARPSGGRTDKKKVAFERWPAVVFAEAVMWYPDSLRQEATERKSVTRTGIRDCTNASDPTPTLSLVGPPSIEYRQARLNFRSVGRESTNKFV